MAGFCIIVGMTDFSTVHTIPAHQIKLFATVFRVNMCALMILLKQNYTVNNTMVQDIQSYVDT